MDWNRLVRSAAGWAGVGIIAIALWLLSRILPVFHGYSIPRAQALCNSGLGQFAQAFSQRAVNDCNAVGVASTVVNLLGIAGLVAVVAALFLRFQKPSQPSPGQPPPGMPPPTGHSQPSSASPPATPPHIYYGQCWCGQVHRQQ
jgi:hypothetical protein